MEGPNIAKKKDEFTENTSPGTTISTVSEL